MEFLAYVATDGPLWKAWTAAHWEKRLRKADYLAANVKAAAAFAAGHISSLSLSFEGSILLGLCRLLLGRWRLIEEDAYELRTALRLSLESGGTLPSVAAVPESALSINCAPYREAQAWEQLDAFAWEGLDLAGPPLELLPEPSVDMGDAALGPFTMDLEGPQHVAPLESITLPEPRPTLTPSADGGDDFPAPSAAERAAMEAISPQQDIDGLPPVDYLLGAGTHGVGSLLPPSTQGRSSGSLGLDLPTPGMPSSIRPLSGIAPVTPPQRDVARVLDFDTPDAPIPGLGARDADSAARRRQAEYLTRMFEDTPQSDAARGVREPTGSGVAGGAEIVVKPPPQKRQRRLPRVYDTATEIPLHKYTDTSRITRTRMHDFDAMLPYTNPRIGYTTVFSDVHLALGEFFVLARQMGQRRLLARQALLLQERADAAAAAARASGPSLGSDPTGMAAADAPASAVAPSEFPSPQTERQLPSPTPRAPSLLGRPSPGLSAASPQVTLPSPAFGAGPDAMEVDAGGLDESCVTEQMDVAMDVDDMDAGEFGVDAPIPSEGAIVAVSPPGDRVAADPEPFDESCRRIGTAQDEFLRESFEASPGSAISFLGMCREPPGDAETATCRFLALLSAHMAGQVRVKQAEPYQDIIITRGPALERAS